MVIFKDTPDIKEYTLHKDEIKDKQKIIKGIKENKKTNRKISKPLYKDIPKYSTYYKIIKYNEKVNNKLMKKEPLQFVKINNKMNKLFKNDIETIKYKIKEKEDYFKVEIIHKQGDEKIVMKEKFKKLNNKYKIKYDIKIFILNYLRNVINDY